MITYRIELIDTENVKRKSMIVYGEKLLGDQITVYTQYINANPLWKINIQSLGE